MAVRKQLRIALLVKTETTAGTDAVPTGAANAIAAANFEPQPLLGDEERRDLVQPYLGNQGVAYTGEYARIAFDVEIAGAGTKGTPPAYGPLLRALGLSETITAGVKVEYQPVSDAQETVTVYFQQDGVRHVLLYARADVEWIWETKRYPKMRFTLTGLAGTITDQTNPTTDTTDFVKPVAVSKANTTLTMGAVGQVAESFRVQLGNTVEPRHLIGAESVEIVNREVKGTAVVEAKALAVQNWFAINRSETPIAWSLQHGTVDGNICEIAGARWQVGRPVPGQTQGIVNYSIPGEILPTTGDDEFKFTVR